MAVRKNKVRRGKRQPLIPVMRDGALWFYVDPETGKEAGTYGPNLSPAMFEARIVAQAHELADNDKSRGVCYFIGGETGPVKIGFSIDPAGRLRTIQAYSPILLSILATRAGGEFREAAYHRQFAAHRLHGEWFARAPEIEAEIARIGGAS